MVEVLLEGHMMQRVHSLSKEGCACGQCEEASQKRATQQANAWLTLSGLCNKQDELKDLKALCQVDSKQETQGKC